MAFIQVRVNDVLKKEATKVYDALGIDLSTAIRMFLTRSVIEGGIPFEMKLSKEDIEAFAALEEAHRISEENGNSKMTLDEINEIIAEVRKDNK